MFNQIFKRHSLINTHIAVPLLRERLTYLHYCANHNTALGSLQRIAHYLLDGVGVLKLEKPRIIAHEEIEHAANIWLHSRKYAHHASENSMFAKANFIRDITHWLKNINLLAPIPEERVELFSRLFKLPRALKRHVNAPLLDERLKYLQILEDNGATKKYLQRLAQNLLVIMDYLEFFELRSISIEEIENAAARRQKRLGTSNRGPAGKQNFIECSITWFSLLGCLKKKNIVNQIAFQEYLDQYLDYMRNDQGLSEITIKNSQHTISKFLIHISSNIKSFGEITPLIIDGFLIKKHDIDSCSRRTIQALASIIRVFIKYAGNKGWCQTSLADSIKTPRVYKHEYLPLSPSWEDVKKILNNFKGNNPTNIRNYAITLLLSIYGMRCSEVTHLNLDDIDWENELIYLKRAKGSRPQIFPLLHIAGEAIISYIKNARPKNHLAREVFLKVYYPYRPLTSASIYRFVNEALVPLNLNIKHHGPHSLRHACATHLVNEGVSLKIISDHLGHANLDTTMIYARVDINSLRQVCEEFIIGDLL